MTRRDLLLLLAAAWNEQSREIVRRLYARPPRGERRAGKLAPDKSTKIRRKGRAVATKNG